MPSTQTDLCHLVPKLALFADLLCAPTSPAPVEQRSGTRPRAGQHCKDPEGDAHRQGDHVAAAGGCDCWGGCWGGGRAACLCNNVFICCTTVVAYRSELRRDIGERGDEGAILHRLTARSARVLPPIVPTGASWLAAHWIPWQHAGRVEQQRAHVGDGDVVDAREPCAVRCVPCAYVLLLLLLGGGV